MSSSAQDTKLKYYRDAGNKYLYIFNHEKCQETKYFNNDRPSNREGTVEDVVRLKKVFVSLGYDVITHRNLTYDKILDAVEDISNQDHTDTACLCFVFLTHREEGGKLYASDRPYSFNDVTAPLESGHQGLVGKPKIYFVQAGRDDKTDPGKTLEVDCAMPPTLIPSHADFLIYNSSVEDFVSFRDGNGSFMIQALCDVIKSHHSELDIQHILTLVNEKVAIERVSYNSKKSHMHNKKQMPEVRHTFTKLFKF